MNKESKLTMANLLFLSRFVWHMLGVIALTDAIAADRHAATVLDNMIILGKEFPFGDQPHSATSYSSDVIDQRGYTALPEIARPVPNWNVISPGGRSVFNIINIRGLSNTLLYSGPSVVFYLDDVPFGITPSYATQLYGLDSIEVYRGPQRSRFGKNSYGGVFKAITRAPHNELEGQLNLQRGNFDQWLLDGALSGAIIRNRLLFSLNGALARRDGFLKNTFLDTRPDSQDAKSGRAKLVWKPNKNWEIRLL